MNLAPGEPAKLLATRFDAEAANQWSLCGLDVGGDYVAALAAEGRGWELWCWRWPGDGSPGEEN